MNQSKSRRLRVNPQIRSLVRETRLHTQDLVYPIFVVEGENIKREIPSLPDCYHYSIDQLEEELGELNALGIVSVLVFGVPQYKDSCASAAFDSQGIVQRAIQKIKQVMPDMYVITDVCMCQYTDHGHCGILDEHGYVDNQQTLPYISRIALSHVQAGADMVAPSDMMDNHVASIRSLLDEHGYDRIPIMGYSAKYASSYYGPFREAAGSKPGFGDRKTYQMDPANAREAMREVTLDVREGADVIMVKPALAYLDILYQMRQRFDLPIAAYSVSGEYAMLRNAVDQGIMKEEVIVETILSIKRAGADIIITYFAKDIARMLKASDRL